MERELKANVSGENRTVLGQKKENVRTWITRGVCLFCFLGFLTSSSKTRLYRGRAPRQSV